MSPTLQTVKQAPTPGESGGGKPCVLSSIRVRAEPGAAVFQLGWPIRPPYIRGDDTASLEMLSEHKSYAVWHGGQLALGLKNMVG